VAVKDVDSAVIKTKGCEALVWRKELGSGKNSWTSELPL
jgi:hypothetical protein